MVLCCGGGTHAFALHVWQISGIPVTTKISLGM